MTVGPPGDRAPPSRWRPGADRRGDERGSVPLVAAALEHGGPKHGGPVGAAEPAAAVLDAPLEALGGSAGTV